jgi:hypothetical protein
MVRMAVGGIGIGVFSCPQMIWYIDLTSMLQVIWNISIFCARRTAFCKDSYQFIDQTK